LARRPTRQEEEPKIRWHPPRGDHLLNYTGFDDLTAIIGLHANEDPFNHPLVTVTNAANWLYLDRAPVFPVAKSGATAFQAMRPPASSP